MDGNKGWLLASGDGGAVTWMTVLNASRNCLADRFSGKTFHKLVLRWAHMRTTYSKKVVNIEGKMLRSQFGVARNSEHHKH